MLTIMSVVMTIPIWQQTVGGGGGGEVGIGDFSRRVVTYEVEIILINQKLYALRNN